MFSLENLPNSWLAANLSHDRSRGRDKDNFSSSLPINPTSSITLAALDLAPPPPPWAMSTQLLRNRVIEAFHLFVGIMKNHFPALQQQA